MGVQQNTNSCNRKGKCSVKILGIVIAAFVIAAVFAAKGGRTFIVAKDIAAEEITEFYCTTATSTNPASRQMYRFYMEGEQWWFYHESREGSHWPLTEADITQCGATELSEEEYEQFISCIFGGKVTKRAESTESGSRGPWIYLYWKGDKGKYQQFSFENFDRQQVFEKLCKELKAD